MSTYDPSTAHPYEHLALVRDVALDETHIPPATTASTMTALEAPPTSAPLWCPKMTDSIHAQLTQCIRIGVMDAEDIALYSHCWHWLDTSGQPTSTQQGIMSIQAKVTGQWTYQFTQVQAQQLLMQITGKSKQQATRIVAQQNGVQAVTITITGKDTTTLPTSEQDIRLIVLSEN